ncbi:hypothetical protein [Mycolicibacterium phlei]|uniref:hypothetical protein n=1 Tax=Mycolicibacterium phlei TaxID=1771 RepID=UPI00058FFEF5|nr:hypothetical protein [Mycolicibacterium phlei]MBF4194587.1 hypothetical protein [Mycolicibacterium phlei]
MTNRNKAKGTQFESLVRDYMKEEWSPLIERMPLSGNADRGDIANFRIGQNGQHLVALELKNRTNMSLSEWVREAQDEAKNYGAVAGAVIHKRKGKASAADQFVTTTLSDFLTILHAAAT